MPRRISDTLPPRFPTPEPTSSEGQLLICLDETPRAAQTLRFAIDNFTKSPSEEINVVFCLPPTTSTLLKTTVTARIKSFLTLVTEKYATAAHPHVKLFVLDRTDIIDAVSDLCIQLQPRMFIMGAASVSFGTTRDPGDLLRAGTGAKDTAYYATNFTPSGSPTPTPFTLNLHEKNSNGSLRSEASASTTGAQSQHQDSILGAVNSAVGDIWATITNTTGKQVTKHSSKRDSGNSGHSYLQHTTPEGKSAYIVEGAFAEAVKESVPVPVVVITVQVAEP
ncbi:hypothetical protein HK100_012267 [Physocladia obscura]|uniref:Uncharacterized protein n=1 Tax=Physocladia obscura TaxID=109957 RepID=A0AAD5T621_9FUNG|nr:hypothetical protein HK100_012267 [Physocladia obscura]